MRAAVFFLVVAGILAIVAVVTRSWPDFRRQRVVLITGAVVLTICSVGLINSLGGFWFQQRAKVRQTAEEAVEALDGKPVAPDSLPEGDGRFQSEVSAAVRQASPVHPSVVARHSFGEHYTVSRSDGDYTFCITVTADEGTPIVVPGGDGELIGAPMLELSASMSGGSCNEDEDD